MDELLIARKSHEEIENVARLRAEFRDNGRPVKVVFVLQQFTFWHSYSSVIQELLSRQGRFSPVVLSLPMKNFKKELEHLSNPLERLSDASVPVLDPRKYNVNKESPDLVFFNDPYHFHRSISYHPSILALRGTLSAIIPYCTEFIGPAEFLSNYFGPGILYFWRSFTASSMSNSIHQAMGIQEIKAPVTGNPEYDRIVNSKPEELTKYHELKDRADGRKIILWTPHFTSGPGWATWDFMGLDLIRLFADHASSGKLFFVIRPHPIMRGMMRSWMPGKKPSGKVEEIATLLHQEEALWLDDDNLAIESVYVADAVISDVSSMLAKAMALGKSVMYTHDEAGPNAGAANPVLTRYVHNSTNVEGVNKFLEMISNGGVDPLLPLPELIRDAFCGPVDGLAGKRIADYLENHFFGNS